MGQQEFSLVTLPGLGTALGLGQRVSLVEAALIFCIKWCKEDNTSFAKILAELPETQRTPTVRENLAYANALYSGLSEGYSA